jgi:signal transduction histidine kinase
LLDGGAVPVHNGPFGFHRHRMTAARPLIRLLLIEDNPGDARLVREHLSDASGGQAFHQEGAGTLEEAARLLESETFDVALLDLNLPDGTGLETLARVQAAAPSLPLIVLTGSDDEAMAVAAVREGAQDYLVKGRIDGDLLAQAIRYAIERKRVQEDLRAAKNDLERRVEERTAELREMNARLQVEIAERAQAQQQASEWLAREQAARALVESANRNKDEFLAILSHELRTPLNAILGWAEILRTGDPTHAESREGIEIIERNARAQARLVEDVLEVSRIICGKLRLNLRQTDLIAVIDAALSSVRPAANAKAIAVRRQLDPAPVFVEADGDRLQQVVWNLLSNAIKFTPRGGIVTISTHGVGDFVEIGVSDTGMGIKPDFLPFVFDRFRQSDASITRAHGGLGLGLSISRHLVEMHSGAIFADSAGEGAGASFIVRLPLLQVAPRKAGDHASPDGAAAAQAKPVPSPLEKVRVLVVDDEPDSRRLVVRLLTRGQAEVREAGSASEAFELLNEWAADVMISDIAMPGEDGYSLIARLRASPVERLRNLPAVALTAFVRPEDRTNALEAGYQIHLSKPCEPGAILSAVLSLTKAANGSHAAPLKE